MLHLIPSCLHVSLGTGLCPNISVGDTYPKQDIDSQNRCNIPDGYLTIIGYTYNTYIGGVCPRHKRLTVLVFQGTHNPNGPHYYLHPFQLPNIACAFCKVPPTPIEVLDALGTNSYPSIASKLVVQPHHPIISEEGLRIILKIPLNHKPNRYSLLELD